MEILYRWLKRNVYGVGTRTSEKEREGDDEDEEVEDHVALEDVARLPLHIKLDTSEDDENKSRYLCPETHYQENPTHYLEQGIDWEKQVCWAEPECFERAEPPLLLTSEFQKPKVDEDEPHDYS